MHTHDRADSESCLRAVRSCTILHNPRLVLSADRQGAPATVGCCTAAYSKRGCRHVEAGECSIAQVNGQLLHVCLKKSLPGAGDGGFSQQHARGQGLLHNRKVFLLCVWDTKAGRHNRHAHHVQRVDQECLSDSHGIAAPCGGQG